MAGFIARLHLYGINSGIFSDSAYGRVYFDKRTLFYFRVYHLWHRVIGVVRITQYYGSTTALQERLVTHCAFQHLLAADQLKCATSRKQGNTCILGLDAGGRRSAESQVRTHLRRTVRVCRLIQHLGIDNQPRHSVYRIHGGSAQL